MLLNVAVNPVGAEGTGGSSPSKTSSPTPKSIASPLESDIITSSRPKNAYVPV